MKTIVIKLSGGALENSHVLAMLWRVRTELINTDYKLVLVHGGGKQLDVWLSESGFSVTKKNGLRVTPSAQMNVVAGVLSGLINKQLVAKAQHAGIAACGLSLLDAGLLQAKFHTDTSLGHVGELYGGDSKMLLAMTENHILPIIASVASCDGELLNINADDAASHIARLMHAHHLIMLTDVQGVLDKNGECVHHLNRSKITRLIDEGIIHGGMHAKVMAALQATQQSRCPVTIMSYHHLDKLPDLLCGLAIGSTVCDDSTTYDSTTRYCTTKSIQETLPC